MNTQYHLRTPKFQPNIPLLDRGFDTESPKLDDFIHSHTASQNDDFYTVIFYETAEKIRQ